MKKSLVAILMVVSMLAMFVGPVAAAPLATERSVTLVSVVYVAGKGPVFTFEVSGNFSNEELNGDLFVVGGEHFPLYCSQIDATTVKCVVSKKAAGKNVTFSWGGFQFSASVPVAPEYCYNVYDWNVDAPYTDWVNFGSYCQERPANYGDSVDWYNSGWNDTFNYEFLPESPDALTCSFPIVREDAYYYPHCPTPIPF